MLGDEKPMENNAEELVWFAMSATFGRELKAKMILENNGVRCFVPMKYQIVRDRVQGVTRRLVPSVRNMLFAYTSKSRIQELKSGIFYLQYLTRPCNGRNVPIVVPENQMRHFITVCNTYNDKLLYLTPDEINVSSGTPVRIIGGPFDGVEGIFLKSEKGRKKRVIVQLQGLAAVMIAEITEGYLQVLQ